jgi:hypothetical protein
MAIKNVTTQNVLTTSSVAYLTAEALDSRTIVKALVTNNSASAVSCTVYVEPSGGAATTETVKALTLSPSETKTLPLSGVAIANGGILYAKASANTAVNLVITYSRTEQAA